MEGRRNQKQGINGSLRVILRGLRRLYRHQRDYVGDGDYVGDVYDFMLYSM